MNRERRAEMSCGLFDLVDEGSNSLRGLSTLLYPIVNAVQLQVQSYRLESRIVVAYDLQKAPISGTASFRDDQTVMRIFFCSVTT